MAEPVRGLAVKVSKLPLIMSILLGLFFLPLGAGLFISGVSKGFSMVPLVLGLMMLVTFAGVLLLVRRGLVRSVKSFSDQGLVRNDGKMFGWNDLVTVVDQVRTNPTGRRSIWRTEIQFRDGDSAWLIPSKVANYGEVRDYVERLPCAHVEKKV